MPHFVDSTIVPAANAILFAFMRTPANLLLLAPKDLHLEIVSAPTLLELGSQVELKGRRWGMAQKTTMEITELEESKYYVEEQRAGPFRQWRHVYRFDALDDLSTRLTDEVTFAPPGGMLGFVVTEARVQRELSAFFHYRNQRLSELLGDATPPEMNQSRPPRA